MRGMAQGLTCENEMLYLSRGSRVIVVDSKVTRFENSTEGGYSVSEDGGAPSNDPHIL